MVVSHDTFPTNRFPTAAFSRLCSASATTLNTSSDRTRAPFCSLTFLPIVAIELTENQCQSVSTRVPPLRRHSEDVEMLKNRYVWGPGLVRRVEFGIVLAAER